MLDTCNTSAILVDFIPNPHDLQKIVQILSFSFPNELSL